MKSIAKFLIPFAICLILLGMLITGVSVANGATWRDNPMLNKVYSLTDSSFINNHWFSGNNWFWNRHSDWNWNDDSEHTGNANNNFHNTVGTALFGSETYINTFPGSINSLNLDIAVAEIKIVEGDSFSIDARNINKDKFTCEVDDGTWDISEKDKEYNKKIWGNWNKLNTPKIKITIPKNTRLDKVDITTSMASIKIDKIIANSTDLTCNMGSIDIYELETKDISVSCDMGSIAITGKVENDAEVDCNMGNVEMYLKGSQADYSYEIDVGMGKIAINDTNFNALNNKTTINRDGNGGTMDLNVGMGNIQIIIRED